MAFEFARAIVRSKDAQKQLARTSLKHRWTCFVRTLPGSQDLLEPLEEATSQVLIPAIVWGKCSKLDRDVLVLPVRCVAMSRSNQFSRTSLKKHSVEGPIEHKTQDKTSGSVASGIPRARHSLM